MKVLLISANRCTDPYPVFPLGLATIAAALRRAGHDVEIFDCLWENNAKEALTARMKTGRPAVIGISVRNIDNENSLHEERYLDDVKDLVRLAHEACAVPVVLGGAGFSIMPNRILAYTGADYGVAGEGEAVIAAFADRAAKGQWPGEKILKQEQPLTGRGIAAGTYDELWIQRYLQHGGGCGVQTKRGCPHRCVYCSYPSIEGRVLRPRDPAAVAEDMARLSRQRPDVSVFFTDSVFNDDQGLYLAVIEELERRGLHTPWSAYFKPTGLTPELIERMKRTGLKSVEMGSDGASDTALRGLGKRFTFADVERSNRLLTEQNVPTAHFVMFGGPNETPESVREGIVNLKRLDRCVIFPFMGIRILPGTELAVRAVREGVLAPDADLLEPAYYFSPELDRAWLSDTLNQAFCDERNIIFPPDAMSTLTDALRAMGHGGSLWELLLAQRMRKSARDMRGKDRSTF